MRFSRIFIVVAIWGQGGWPEPHSPPSTMILPQMISRGLVFLNYWSKFSVSGFKLHSNLYAFLNFERKIVGKFQIQVSNSKPIILFVWITTFFFIFLWNQAQKLSSQCFPMVSFSCSVVSCFKEKHRSCIDPIFSLCVCSVFYCYGNVEVEVHRLQSLKNLSMATPPNLFLSNVKFFTFLKIPVNPNFFYEPLDLVIVIVVGGVCEGGRAE